MGFCHDVADYDHVTRCARRTTTDGSMSGQLAVRADLDSPHNRLSRYKEQPFGSVSTVQAGSEERRCPDCTISSLARPHLVVTTSSDMTLDSLCSRHRDLHAAGSAGVEAFGRVGMCSRETS